MCSPCLGTADGPQANALAALLVGAEERVLHVEFDDLAGRSEVPLVRLQLANGETLPSIDLAHKQVIELPIRTDAHNVLDGNIRRLKGTHQTGAILTSAEHALRHVPIHGEVVCLRLDLPLLDLHVVGISIVCV